MGKLITALTVAIASLAAGVAPRRAAEGAFTTERCTRTARPDTAPRTGVVFEENRGQTDASVSFIVRQSRFTAFVAPGAVTFSAADDAVRMTFRGTSDRARIDGRAPTGGHSSFFRGTASVAGARHFANAVTTDLYSGIDLRWHGDSSQRLTYDLVVAPEADPSRIEFDVSGATGVHIAPDGTLRVATPGGEFTHGRPVVFQTKDESRVEVEGAFVLRGDRRVGFDVGRYDHTAELVIDPSIEYSGRFGGTISECRGITVDASGAAYVTGSTRSVAFPAEGARAGWSDAFVTKFAPDGASAVWSVFLGGDNGDEGYGIAVNSQGEAIVCGSTSSQDFPVVSSLYEKTNSGAAGFVTRLSADGRSLLYSTFIVGPGGQADAYAIALDAQGAAYVTGGISTVGPFATPGSFQTTPLNGDVFVTKLAPDGSSVVWATLLGGDGWDVGTGIAVGGAGNAYVCGTTGSRPFPVTGRILPGPTPGVDASDDVFLSELAPDGSALVYSVTLGSDFRDWMAFVAVDASGAAYVTCHSEPVGGPTPRPRVAYPVTHRPAGAAVTSRWGAYVMKVSPAGDALDYSVRVGGASAYGSAIAVEPDGTAYVAGATRTPDPASAIQLFGTGSRHGANAFLCRLAPDARSVTYTAVLGGWGHDQAYAVALGPDRSVYIAGSTGSSGDERNEPPFDRVLTGPAVLGGAFVTKFAPQSVPLSIRRGGAETGVGARAAVQFLGKHGFRKSVGIFDPSARDVTVTVTAGANVRTITIPANDPGWKRKPGGVLVWDSAFDASPRWSVGFSGVDGYRVVISNPGFTDVIENPFSIDVAVGSDRGFDRRPFRRVPGPRPRFQMP